MSRYAIRVSMPQAPERPVPRGDATRTTGRRPLLLASIRRVRSSRVDHVLAIPGEGCKRKVSTVSLKPQRVVSKRLAGGGALLLCCAFWTGCDSRSPAEPPAPPRAAGAFAGQAILDSSTPSGHCFTTGLQLLGGRHALQYRLELTQRRNASRRSLLAARLLGFDEHRRVRRRKWRADQRSAATRVGHLRP